MKRNVYLKAIDLPELEVVLKEIMIHTNYSVKNESVAIMDAFDRITSEAVYAKISSPNHTAAAMDGIAVRSNDTLLASDHNPLRLFADKFMYTNTGNALVDGYDSVIMIEDIEEHDDGSVTIIKPVSMFEHVRPIGEDIVQGDMILPKYHRIRSIDMSALISGGLTHVKLIKKPKVAIIPTGDEIISNPKDMKKGKIIDSNSYYVKKEIELLGCKPSITKISKDTYDLLEKDVVKASNNSDIVLVIAGSSAGSKDFVREVVEQNGSLFAHGISVKPGKPTVIGEINNVPVIGLPGYPVSTFVAFEIVVKKLVNFMLHQTPKTKDIIDATLAKKVYSSLKHKEFVRVKLGKINNAIIAVPLSRGAGVTMSLVKADGILIIDKNIEGHEAGEKVKVELFKDISEIDKTLISIGSHDIIMDRINDHMSDEGYHLSSSHVGSYGGIMAMKNKECHIAPVHILGENGVYNEFILDKYLNTDYTIVRGLSRVQGFYVKKGNPKKIKNIKDLMRSDIHFVNRQRGSGTRILLDHLLSEHEILPEQINGYEFELSTHTMIASSVKDDRFDVGVGVKSVANINKIGFVELANEHYDFIVLKEIMETPMYDEFIKVIQSDKFKSEINKIGGYNIDNIGEVIYESDVRK